MGDMGLYIKVSISVYKEIHNSLLKQVQGESKVNKIPANI